MNINSEKILVEFQLFLKSLPNSTESKLISFAFSLEKPENLDLINNLSEAFVDIILFRTSNDKILTIGLNSTLELNPENSKQFSEVANNFNYWKQNFLYNRTDEFNPAHSIIFCSAKFDSNNSTILWSEFHTLRFYVPEFVLVLESDRLSGHYNFRLNEHGQFDFHSSRLSFYLKKLTEQKTDTFDSTNVQTDTQYISNDDGVKSWNETAAKGLKSLKAGDVDKLVLSRIYSFNLNGKIDWDNVIKKLYKRFPECYLFFIKKCSSIFFGSSPEMFLKVSNNNVEVESVAGSAARGEKIESDDELEKFLSTSEKNHKEHLFVSDFIIDNLTKYSDQVYIVEEKQIRKLDNIQHLITRISARLISKRKLFELIDALFPTPAVCGVPKEKAMNLIRKLENHDRGLYSGLVGTFDFEGNCEIAVSIRSALVKENQVTAFAGAGLVQSSELQEEFLETNLKLNTILSLFTDENKS